MNKIFAAIAGIAILGSLFNPGIYANSYHVPKLDLKEGITVEANIQQNHSKFYHYSKVHSGQSLDYVVENDRLIAQHYHASKPLGMFYHEGQKMMVIKYRN